VSQFVAFRSAKVRTFAERKATISVVTILPQETHMTRLIGCICILTTPLVLSADDKDDVQKELKALQGTWKAVALEADGMSLPKTSVPDFTFVIGADGKSTGKIAKMEYGATITVDPKKNPKTMDNLHESGASKGKKQFAVYKLEGDKLTVCITAPGKMESDRPKDFNTKDTANVVFVFERVKEEERP
jgi:uncharacterized protein (TIGR03067 family)